MSGEKHLLEHFYYGHLVKDDKPDGEQRLLFASPGVSEKLAAQCVERVTLPPDVAGGAWALVRGRSRQFPFILVQSQKGAFGQIVSHYIIAQPDMLRAVGGNLKALMTLVEDELPVFKDTWSKPKRLELEEPEPLSVDAQIDDILELMMVAKNRIQVIEPLLAAIVQGNQLIIRGAPESLQERVQFISGLLALLPSSARFGVTFTTHSLPSTEIDTQIRFYSDDDPPPDTVVFDWAGAKVSGEELSDDYSHYMMSLLRLDASLVIERAGAMASIAGWRLNEGDNLADALGYASKRFKLDEALRNNQPIDKDEAARVLADDPTLSTELRKLYAEHLIRFSLAMKDMSHAKPVAVLLRADRELAVSALQQMEEAIQDGQAELIYDTLADWMANPLGPQGPEWVELTHRSLMSLVKRNADEQDVDGLLDWLEEMITADPALALDQVTPKIIGMALPYARADETLAQYIYLIGMKYLNVDGFKRLMAQAALVDQLPPHAKHAWNYIESGKVDEAPAGFLVQTAHAVGGDWEPLVLIRLTEMAIRSGAKTALDGPTIKTLLQIATSDDKRQYEERLLALVNVVDENMLKSLGPEPATHLLQIRLALGDYAGLARQMIRQSMLLYSGDGQADYIDAVYQVFAETPLSADATAEALRSIRKNRIKELPYAIAVMGALQGLKADEALREIANEAVDYLLVSSHVHDLVPPAAAVTLVQFYSDARDATGMLRSASIVPRIAIRRGVQGIKLLARIYKDMNWNGAAQKAALQMLRVFVREVPDDVGRKAVDYFGKELGGDVRQVLEISLTVQRSLGGRSIMSFARSVHVVCKLLHDCAALYAEKSQPDAGDILKGLEAITGVPTSEERGMLAKSLERIGRAIIQLGGEYRSGRPRNEDDFIDELLQANTDPRSTLDILRVLAGILSQGKRAYLDVPSRSTMQVLASRDVPEWVAEVKLAGELIAAMTRASSGKGIKVTAAGIRDEMRSIWETLDEESQQTLRRALAPELQRFIDLIVRIEAEGDAKTFDDANLAKRIQAGKHKPRNTLEFLRLAQVYYSARL